jgi:hypothetical protein
MMIPCPLDARPAASTCESDPVVARSVDVREVVVVRAAGSDPTQWHGTTVRYTAVTAS